MYISFWCCEQYISFWCCVQASLVHAKNTGPTSTVTVRIMLRMEDGNNDDGYQERCRDMLLVYTTYDWLVRR